jgi:hypothetical protein
MRNIMLLVLLCAAPLYAQNPTTDFRTGAGCGPQKTQFEVALNPPDTGVIAPSPGKARVYVIEVVGAGGGGITTRVGVDGNWVAANTSEGYLSFEVDPGSHNICSDWQSMLKLRQHAGAAMVIRAEVGRTYYFVVSVLPQATDFNLTRVHEAEGQWPLSMSQKNLCSQKKK